MGMLMAVDVSLTPRIEKNLEEITAIFKLDRGDVIRAVIEHWDDLEVIDPDQKDIIGESLTEGMSLIDYRQQVALNRALGDIAASMYERIHRATNFERARRRYRKTTNKLAIVEMMES